jgi:hypothetical protein
MMDCRVVRLLLPAFGPRLGDLSEEDRQDLETHVAKCAACGPAIEQARREERLIAAAMIDVPIPDGLRNRLSVGLRAERARWYRTWPSRHRRWVAAAAVFLLAVCGATTFWWHRPLPAIDVAYLVYEFGARTSSATAVEDYYRNWGRRIALPTNISIAYLDSCALEMLEGKLVPCLRFRGSAREQVADIFIISDRDFDLSASFAKGAQADSGGIKIELVSFEDLPHFAYVMKYTPGDDLTWLFPPKRPGA